MTTQTSPLALSIRNVDAIHAPSFAPNLSRDYVVKNLFNTKEVSMIIGAPGLGKTAIVAAIAAHAALGRDFADFYTRESCVLFFAAEDAYGVLCRAHPYLADPAYASAPFYVVPLAIDLTDPSSVRDIVQHAKRIMAEHGMTRALIVIDTLNRSIGGNDENSAAVMGLVLQHAAEIASATNGAMVLVHHVGNGDAGRPRGSSALEGNVDGLYSLAKADKNASLVLLRPKKTKNARAIAPVTFKIESHFVGLDADGDPVSVPKAVPQGDAATAPSAEPANVNGKPDAIGPERAADVLRVLRDECLHNPGGWLSPPSIADRTGSPFRGARKNRDSLLKAVRRALSDLVEQDEIEMNHGNYRALNALATDTPASST